MCLLFPLRDTCNLLSVSLIFQFSVLETNKSRHRRLRESPSGLWVGRSDGCEDVHENHNQQVENCGHDAHNAERVLQVHLAQA